MHGITTILEIVSIVLIGLIIGCIILLIKTNKAIRQAQFNNQKVTINTNYQPYSNSNQTFVKNSHPVNDFNQQQVYNQVPTKAVVNPQPTYQPSVDNFNQTTNPNSPSNMQPGQPSVTFNTNGQPNNYDPHNYQRNDGNNQGLGF